MGQHWGCKTPSKVFVKLSILLKLFSYLVVSVNTATGAIVRPFSLRVTGIESNANKVIIHKNKTPARTKYDRPIIMSRLTLKSN